MNRRPPISQRTYHPFPTRRSSDLTYARQVRDAATTGFAVDRGYTHRGVCTVAVGIADVAPCFALSASIVIGSRSEAEIEALGAELIALRHQLKLWRAKPILLVSPARSCQGAATGRGGRERK